MISDVLCTHFLIVDRLNAALHSLEAQILCKTSEGLNDSGRSSRRQFF